MSINDFAGIWAPQNGRFNLSVNSAQNTAKDSRSVVSWFAASGRNIGGPDALTPHPSLAGAAYEYGPSAGKLKHLDCSGLKPTL